MEILIISTMTNNFGKKGLYNSQEIGLAHGLAELGHNIHIFKCVKSKDEEEFKKLDTNIWITYKHCNCLGSNGFVLPAWIKKYKNHDVVIQFADLQLTVPLIYRWCKKNSINYIPYVGITYSQSQNKIAKFIAELLFRRNLIIYRRTGCIAKTPSVQDSLYKLKVKNVKLGYVCFDPKQLLAVKESELDRKGLRKRYGIGKEKVLLFIGRFELDKRPVDMVRILSKLKDKTMKLIMVGNGYLHADTVAEAFRLGIKDRVIFINQISNQDIWQLYYISDLFINLNFSEIWGMVLLEAMYYQTPVIARSAPGPDTIIENGISGYIVQDDKELIDLLNFKNIDFGAMKANAYKRVRNLFDWKNTAKVFEKFSEDSIQQFCS